MPAPYRRSSRQSGLFMLFFMAGVAGGIAWGSQFEKDSIGAWILLVIVTPIVIGIVVGLVVLDRLDKRRIREIARNLHANNFRANTDPNESAKAAALEPISHLPSWAGLGGGAANIVWLAFLDSMTQQVLVFEHCHVTGSGKSTQEIIHTVAAVQSRDLSAAGWTITGSLILNRPRWGEARLLKRAGVWDLQGDDAFEKKWIVRGDAHTATRMLSAAVRAVLMDSPKGESWHVGGGWVCCVYAGSMNAENILKYVHRAVSIVEMVEQGV